MKTREEWIETLHAARRNGCFLRDSPSFWYKDLDSRVADSFLYDCLVALHCDKAGADMAKVMNEEDNGFGFDPLIFYRKWNNPKSKVRNFLLVLSIDYPLGK